MEARANHACECAAATLGARRTRRAITSRHRTTRTPPKLDTPLTAAARSCAEGEWSVAAVEAHQPSLSAVSPAARSSPSACVRIARRSGPLRLRLRRRRGRHALSRGGRLARQLARVPTTLRHHASTRAPKPAAPTGCHRVCCEARGKYFGERAYFGTLSPRGQGSGRPTLPDHPGGRGTYTYQHGKAG